MKIYCARQPKSDADMLNSLIGTDNWVKVTIHEAYAYMDYYIKINRVVSKGTKTIKQYYVFNAITTRIVTETYTHRSYWRFDDLMKAEYKAPVEDVVIAQPLELYTTEELRTIFESNGSVI